MAGRKLAVNVTTPDENGRMVTYMAGETVSAEVAEGITNPKAWETPEADDGEAADAKKSTRAPAKKSTSSSN